MEQPQHVEITLGIETAFERQDRGHLALGNNAPHVSGSKRQFHLVGVCVQHPIERLDQPASLLHRVVVVVVGVLDIDRVDDNVEPPLLGASVVEQPRLLNLPRVDLLVKDRRDDVDMAVDDDRLIVQLGRIDRLRAQIRGEDNATEQ